MSKDAVAAVDLATVEGRGRAWHNERKYLTHSSGSDRPQGVSRRYTVSHNNLERFCDHRLGRMPSYWVLNAFSNVLHRAGWSWVAQPS